MTLPAVEWSASRLGRFIRAVSAPGSYCIGGCVGCSGSAPRAEQKGLYLLQLEPVPDPVYRVLRESILLLYAM